MNSFYINITLVVLFITSSLKAEHTNTQRTVQSVDANLPDVIREAAELELLMVENKTNSLLSDNTIPLPNQNDEREIRGIIIDEGGEALPGATVVVKESKRGTTTDINGNFTLLLHPNDKTLVISFLGLETQEIPIEGITAFRIALKPAPKALDEVIVTGYQRISRERATGSYNMIRAEQIEKPTTNIGQRLIGATSGIQVKNYPDGRVLLEVRGQSSLSPASNQPLVVLDGFPIQGDLRTVNPNDIDNITILKDAAAASIWGARSANGVIVITSKSGANKSKGVTVEFNSFITFSPKADIYYQSPHASSAEVIDYEKMAFESNFFGGPWRLAEDSNTDLFNAYSLALTTMNEHRLGYLSSSELETLLADYRKRDNREQIKKLLYQNPFTQQYNLSIFSKTNKSSNVITLLYENRKFDYRGNDAEKYNINYRTTASICKWLDFSFFNTFIIDNQNLNGEKYNGPPYQMLLNDDGTRANIPRTYYWPNIERHVPYKSFPYDDWSYNPVSELESKDFRRNTLNARTQLELQFNIMQGLTFDSKLMYEIIHQELTNYFKEESFTVRNQVNTTSTWNRETNEITPNLPKGGFLDRFRMQTSTYNWRNQLNFNRNFFDRDMFIFIAGTEIMDVVNKSIANPRTYGYDDEKISVGTFPNGVGGSSKQSIYGWRGESLMFSYTNNYGYSTDRYFSFYGNASYSIHDKYTFSASARTDASNLITDDPKYRYAPFWSAGASWAMHNEEFMQPINWLNRLVVRTTFGFNGNVDKSTSFKPLIDISNTQDIYIQNYTANISSFGNPTLRWEKTSTFNFGVDFSLLNAKLYGKVDLYNKKGRDLIVSMSIPAVNGSSFQYLNMAEITNRGVEFEIGSSQTINPNIIWNGNLNFTYNRNVIDKLFKTIYTARELYNGSIGAYVEGYNSNTLWSFEYAGVANKGTEKEPDWQPVVKGPGGELIDFSTPATGDARDYMLNMGTKVAPILIGLTNSFKIFDFDISFIITGKFGHVFNGFIFNYPSMVGGQGIPNKLYAETLNSDPSKRAPIPIGKKLPRYFLWDDYYPYLDYRVQNAGHIRFQELNLTYSLNRKILDKIGLNSIRIYAQANNLFIIANNRYNEDPEYPLETLRPQPAYTLGLNVSF